MRRQLPKDNAFGVEAVSRSLLAYTAIAMAKAGNADAEM